MICYIRGQVALSARQKRCEFDSRGGIFVSSLGVVSLVSTTQNNSMNLLYILLKPQRYLDNYLSSSLVLSWLPAKIHHNCWKIHVWRVLIWRGAILSRTLSLSLCFIVHNTDKHKKTNFKKWHEHDLNKKSYLPANLQFSDVNMKKAMVTRYQALNRKDVGSNPSRRYINIW